MFGLLTRLLSGATALLIDQISDISARLLKKLALFFVAAICLVVVLIALTVAFDLWVASRAGPIAGALAVAGLYLAVALIALFFALYDRRGRNAKASAEQSAPASSATSSTRGPEHDARVDEFTAPLLDMLARLGLRREQLAVLAGATVAKRVGPIPMVGLAILGGFLVGRLMTSWRSLMSVDLVTALLSALDLAANARPAPETDVEEDKAA